jgi:predicted nucleotidyltransferase
VLVETRDEPAFAAIGALVAGMPRVCAAWVFGSVGRGDATEQSDLDVAVLLEGQSSGQDEETLRGVSGQLERFSPSGRVDVIVLGRQGSVFRHRVLREGRLVVDRDPEARRAFETRTIIDYLDWKPTHDIAMASALDGLRDRFAKGMR